MSVIPECNSHILGGLIVKHFLGTLPHSESLSRCLAHFVSACLVGAPLLHLVLSLGWRRCFGQSLQFGVNPWVHDPSLGWFLAKGNPFEVVYLFYRNFVDFIVLRFLRLVVSCSWSVMLTRWINDSVERFIRLVQVGKLRLGDWLKVACIPLMDRCGSMRSFVVSRHLSKHRAILVVDLFWASFTK